MKWRRSHTADDKPTHLDTRDLGYRIPLIRGFQRPRQQAFLAHRLRRMLGVDAARRGQEQELAHRAARQHRSPRSECRDCRGGTQPGTGCWHGYLDLGSSRRTRGPAFQANHALTGGGIAQIDRRTLDRHEVGKSCGVQTPQEWAEPTKPRWPATRIRSL